MIVMVLEAAKQIALDRPSFSGIELRDVHFERGLVIPDEQAVETLLSIQPHTSDDTWYSFAIFSKTGSDSWVKHCFGEFFLANNHLQYSDISAEVACFDWNQRRLKYEEIKTLPSNQLRIKDFYKNLTSNGMDYGQTFQNVSTASVSVDHKFSHGIVVSISSSPSSSLHSWLY